MLDKIEAAALIGVKPRTLDRWSTENKGPVFRRVGRLRRYRLDDIERFISSRPTGGEQMPEAA